MNSKEAD